MTAAVGSAGGGAMMMWVATHNAKSQERANEAVDKARDMLDIEKAVTEFRQKLNNGKAGSPEQMKALSDEINHFVESYKDTPFYEDIKAQLQPTADSLAFEAAKHFIGQLANNDYMSPEELAKAREFVKNPSFRKEYPGLTDVIENGHLDYGEANSDARKAGRGALVIAGNDGPVFDDGKVDWHDVKADNVRGKGDGAQKFDHGDGLQKELNNLQRNSEDFANMASKERELLMTDASEKRDMARQTNEQGAKLISNQDKTNQDIISTIYRA
jgi:hypothetical protein